MRTQEDLKQSLQDELAQSPACETCSTSWTAACVASGVGAGLMYLFDPTLGRRRRKWLADKFRKNLSRAGHIRDIADTTWRDLKNRVQGTIASVKSWFRSGDAADNVIEDRVRSRLGRYCSHPHAIQVLCDDGVVTLNGDCLQNEMDEVLKIARSTKGVLQVCNQLIPHSTAEHFQRLQGGHARTGMPANILKANWAPATRFVIGSAGVALMTNCALRRTLPAALLGTLGFAMFMRAATNLPARQLIGAGTGRRAIDVRKIINIDSPIDVVFGFWSNYDNFPLFMRNVKQVSEAENGISHWVVSGPAGTTVEWDALLTDYEPNRKIGWKTISGSTVAHCGTVCFQENPDGTTRVDIHLRYNPLAGAIGHAIASLFGADPMSEMNEDLIRMKTLVETGNFPRDAARQPVTSENV